jgi:fatty-acyl-CoA synthase
MMEPTLQADIVGERARLTPKRPALVVVEPELRLDYGELDERVARCARVLTEILGMGHGDRVGILSHNRVEYLEAFFAAGKTGITVVPLGTRLTAAELEHIIRDSGLRILLYDEANAETVGRLRSLVALEAWVALDSPLETNDASYADLVASLPNDSAWQPTLCDGEDLFALLYTSGTTGQPKGVMIPHRMVIANAFNTVCGWQLTSSDISPVFTPLYHTGGLMAFMVPLFVIGGTVVLHRGFDAAEVLATIESEGCTVVLGVPAIWKMLLEAPEFATVDLCRVRWFISGGAPLPHYLIEAYQEKQVPFKQGFGMTEVGVNCFSMSVEDSYRKAGSVGQPMMFTQVRLIDESGADVPEGEVGELLFRGPHVCQGYWNQSAATAAALDADGWFHSGDQARRDGEGFYTIAGRQKDMIISGGVNVYPAEIENLLVQHPGVEDAAVVGVPDQRWGEVGVAFIVRRSNSNDLLEKELREFLAPRLARFKTPKAFRFIDHLPRTDYGKVLKSRLRDEFLGEEA